MKFILIGHHASGKYEVLSHLEEMGIKVAHEFATATPKESVYHDPNYIQYSIKDADSIFEVGAYLYMGGPDIKSTNLLQGLSQYEYEEHDVCVIPLDYLSCLNEKLINKEDVVVVWLDNTLNDRITRHAQNDYKYNFQQREQIESICAKYMFEFANRYKQIYFLNEDPIRVATILKVLVEHPEYVEMFAKNYN